MRQKIVQAVSVAAIFVALQPMLNFVLHPPPGSEIEWVVTLVALGVWGFCQSLLWASNNRSSPSSDAREL